MSHLHLSLLLVLPLVSSCGAARQAPDAGAEPRAIGLPASALAGAVRALETLDAVRPEGALAQVRALEGDTLIDRDSGAEYVRIFLHLTVYAATSADARAAFDELRAALETEGRSDARVEAASNERVGRVMTELDWNPRGRENLVSFSDAIRLEVTPGRNAQAPPAELAPEPLYGSLATYVRTVADRERIGQVEVAVSPAGVVHGAEDHRFRITELSDSARHGLAEIGGFLSALEAGSPVARLTKLKIERSQHEPDIHAARGWTFEAELSVRTLAVVEPRVAGIETTQR